MEGERLGSTASDEGLGGRAHLSVGAAVDGEPMPVAAYEHRVPGAPILFATEEDHLLPAIFAREDDLLLERTLHEFTSFALSGLAFMNYYRASGWPALREASSHILGAVTRSTKLR